MLKRCLFLFTTSLLFGCATAYAQKHNSINASGGEAKGGTGTVNFSVGQLIYSTYSNGNVSIAEGVQQAYEIYTISTPEYKSIDFDVNIYPNPTTDYLIIDLKKNPSSSVNYQLTDLSGQVLKTARINSDKVKIQMREFAKSTYLLYLWDKGEKVNAYKIIKH